MLALLACSALPATAPESPADSVGQAYEGVRARVGRSAEGQVRLVLW